MFNIFVLFLLFSFVFFSLKNKQINLSNRNIIVTGASSNHELSLLQFIYHCFNNDKKIALVVWDLGLSKKFKNLIVSIIKHYKFIIFRIFDYSNYPYYFNINKNQGEYAWKPIIINITFHMVKKTILWLDSGCVVASKMNDVFNEIEKFHCWSTYTIGNIKIWTHAGMIKYYNLSYNSTLKKLCNGAIVGFKWNSKISSAILNEWVDCASVKQCIAPDGSNRGNHRQDQSALSILIYKYKVLENCPINKFKIYVHKDLNNRESANIIYKKIFKIEKSYF